MTLERSIRRLAAILAADVVGYSSMMAADEAGTFESLRRHRKEVFDPVVQAHGGRTFKTMGDGTLVEFASVVDAVNCAVEIQRLLRSSEPSHGTNIVLRIGINIGDIIVDADDAYGDGVNIAARLESVAEPGGICVAAMVNESVGNRSTAKFRDGGEVVVKNIVRPVRVWRWHPDQEADGSNPAQIGSRTLGSGQTPSKPTVAVLPFDNLSGDTQQEYFSDGMTEDIITDLSKVAGLLVISRSSSFTYKGRKVDIRVVGTELGATAVLAGSIRRSGSRLRINASLVETKSGTQLWAERYDRDLTDIFTVQDDVATKLVAALKVKLTPAETSLIGDVSTRSIEAHDMFLRGREALVGSENTREAFELAVRSFTRAIELDPNYAEPYVGLAHAYNRDFQNKWSGRSDSKDLFLHYCRLGLEKGPELPYAHYMAALERFWQSDHTGAEAAIDRALALNPNYVLAVGMRGLIQIYNGRPLDALPDLERAILLDPLTGHLYWHFIGSAYLVAGQYAQAVDAFRQRILMSPGTDLSRGLLIAALGHLDRNDEAKQIAAELHEIRPQYSFEDHVSRLPFSNTADVDRIRAGFSKAGVN